MYLEQVEGNIMLHHFKNCAYWRPADIGSVYSSTPNCRCVGIVEPGGCQLYGEILLFLLYLLIFMHFAFCKCCQMTYNILYINYNILIYAITGCYFALIWQVCGSLWLHVTSHQITCVPVYLHWACKMATCG